jgi:hypothetical protein
MRIEEEVKIEDEMAFLWFIGKQIHDQGPSQASIHVGEL